MKDYANDVKLILNPVKLFPSSLPCYNIIIFFTFHTLFFDNLLFVFFLGYPRYPNFKSNQL